MDVLHGWREVAETLKGASLAIGNFDGVHRGHCAALNAAKRAAGADVPVGAMVFEPHPRKFFQPEKPLFQLTSLNRKLELLAACGLDLVAVLPFDTELSSLDAENFVHDILVESFAVRHVTIGYNFYFGKGRRGNPSLMSHLGEKYNFGVTVVEPVGDSGEIFSSTRIRELLAEGDVAGAAEMLGRCWQIEGVVESGAGRGGGLGFPTRTSGLAPVSRWDTAFMRSALA